jgi:hypothetical protein
MIYKRIPEISTNYNRIPEVSMIYKRIPEIVWFINAFQK